jgi:hypothetical protein
MAGGTIRVRGHRELVRALNMVEGNIAKTLRDELKRAAKPVVDASKRKLSRYQGASLGTIGPRASVSGVFVTQRARKVTGERPDFGRLQQVALEEALEEHEEETVRGVEQAFDRLVRSVGF